jgi:broad specificity phosphatase PhoE
MTCLVFIRHGETDWNLEGRWQGQADVPLNQRGWQQAIRLADSLANDSISVIYSSDLRRAMDTATLLAQKFDTPVIADARLREIHQGEWQGLLVTEIEARYKEVFQKRKEKPMFVAPPGGETVQQVCDRALSVVQEIVQDHTGQNVAVVSHGFTIAVILVQLQNKPIDRVWEMVPKNGEVIRVEADESLVNSIRGRHRV